MIMALEIFRDRRVLIGTTVGLGLAGVFGLSIWESSHTPVVKPPTSTPTPEGFGGGQEVVESTATWVSVTLPPPTQLPDCPDINHTMRVGPETPFPSGIMCVMGDGKGGSWLFVDIGKTVNGTPERSLVHIP